MASDDVLDDVSSKIYDNLIETDDADELGGDYENWDDSIGLGIKHLCKRMFVWNEEAEFDDGPAGDWDREVFRCRLRQYMREVLKMEVEDDDKA